MEPASLLELPLLHMEAQMHNVEARLTRGKFDHGLLALLLLWNGLRLDDDAGKLGEFFGMPLQEVTARALDQVCLELGASVLLVIDTGPGCWYLKHASTRCGTCPRYKRAT